MTKRKSSPELHIHRDGNPPTKEELLRGILDYYTPFLEVIKPGGVIDKTGEIPEDKREEYRQMYSRLKEIRDSWEEAEREYLSPDTPEERKREISYSVEEWYLNLVLLHSQNPDYFTEGEVKLPDYRIVVDSQTGERRESRGNTHLWGDKYFIPGKGILTLHPEEMRDPLEDLGQIRESAKTGLVKVSSDLWKSFNLGLSLISEETRKAIEKKEAEGKLLAGSLVGLKGGSRYFKVFNIALAQTLYEQSKYYDKLKDPNTGETYNTLDNLSGVPRDLISQYAGEGAVIKDPTDKLKGGERPFPIVLLSWEDLAKKMSPDGKISGGKDIKVVRDFVQGYKQKLTDPKTGKVKTAIVPGLLGREYLVEGRDKIIGVPYMSKIFSIYPKDSPDKEVGIAVQLSPLFAQSLQFGYTGIRSDTIQKLGGGKIKEITINLFYYLAYNRGIPPQKGRRKGEFPRIKSDLLEELSEGIKSYTNNPKRREADFRDAVQKCIDAKILLPGKTKTGLRGYREEINPGGRTLSIFTYNPDYLKGEEVNLFSGIEDQ